MASAEHEGASRIPLGLRVTEGVQVMTATKAEDDLVDAGSEYSFPASDPPSYMGGALIAGPPPHDGEPPREPVSHELINPDEARPAEGAL
ncbi:hypothetical protein J4G37_21080 [Microvirga sp. 3-52]|nr:hypothetical protein [Microvirga sp. 3-52]